MGWFSMMSEDWILEQLASQTDDLIENIKAVYDMQKGKLEATRQIIDNMRDSPKTSEKLKKKVGEIIDAQEKHARNASRTIEKIKHYLNLLVQMEQASLVIHNKKSQDDLSQMIDVIRLPMDKFDQEQEQVRLLENSIQILNVELGKQRQYLKAFDLNPNTPEEEYFMHSGEYESKISESDIIKISELKSFVLDLEKMISARKGQKIDRLTESDKAAMAIRDEMNNIIIGHKLVFPVTCYGFMQRLVKSTIMNKDMDRLMLFLIAFLFSRLKKYRKASYYSQLRAAILSYNLLRHQSFQQERLNTIVGAALLGNIHNLDFTPDEIDNSKDDMDETTIIKHYYRTVNAILADEFPFISNLLSLHRKTEIEDPLVPWVVDGSRCLGLIYDFDKTLIRYGFDAAKVSLEREKDEKKLKQKYSRMKEIDKTIDYLYANWERLIPKSLKQ